MTDIIAANGTSTTANAEGNAHVCRQGRCPGARDQHHQAELSANNSANPGLTSQNNNGTTVTQKCPGRLLSCCHDEIPPYLGLATGDDSALSVQAGRR